MKWDQSEKLYELSQHVIPGGVNSPVRAFRRVGRNPIFIQKAKGPYLYDVDGNQYIDYVCSWGANLLGHSHPDVIKAVLSACENGLTFGAPTELEYKLASIISKNMPSMESIRLVSSGTEAVMSAIRVARGYTNRDYIIKFRGCYHGHSDGLLVQAGSGALTESIPDSAGVPSGYARYTLIGEYNDLQSVERLFSIYPNQIAAVIVEPVAANMGIVLPQPGFLEGLRKMTTENDSLLIFDEVITGFRLGLGGAQGYYQVTLDLTTLGKIVGGGMPLAAYGGSRKIMDMIAPIGPVYQAGTLSGNPIATAAGYETIGLLATYPQYYDILEERAKRLKVALENKFEQSIIVNQIGSLLTFFFHHREVQNYEDVMESNTIAYVRFFHYLLENGVYIAPSPYEAMFLSIAHEDEVIDRTIEIINGYIDISHDSAECG